MDTSSKIRRVKAGGGPLGVDAQGEQDRSRASALRGGTYADQSQALRPPSAPGSGNAERLSRRAQEILQSHGRDGMGGARAEALASQLTRLLPTDVALVQEVFRMLGDEVREEVALQVAEKSPDAGLRAIREAGGEGLLANMIGYLERGEMDGRESSQVERLAQAADPAYQRVRQDLTQVSSLILEGPKKRRKKGKGDDEDTTDEPAAEQVAEASDTAEKTAADG